MILNTIIVYIWLLIFLVLTTFLVAGPLFKIIVGYFNKNWNNGGRFKASSYHHFLSKLLDEAKNGHIVNVILYCLINFKYSLYNFFIWFLLVFLYAGLMVFFIEVL